jgi:hypothetical protein
VAQNGIVEVHLSEQLVEGKRLGRHVHHDPRSRNYPASQASQIVNVRHESTGLPLDQRAHRCSTAHALCGALDSAPNFTGGTPLTETAAIRVYEQATVLKGESSSAGEESGSSGLMACKAAKELELISSYEHAFGIEHALRALVLRPVMTGINWYTSFDQPDPETGLVEIAPGATVRGGHEVLADEIDSDNELVWFRNSWGRDFGIDGRFCMSFDTWRRLLEERGDVTVPLA